MRASQSTSVPSSIMFVARSGREDVGVGGWVSSALSVSRSGWTGGPGSRGFSLRGEIGVGLDPRGIYPLYPWRMFPYLLLWADH